MISEDVIAEIRSRSDIVAVIGQHVQLRKAGRNFKGLCPFHGEKTPSFNVAADKGFFYCFGCQKKGDVFTFIMELEGKSFIEAAERLAALAGIHLVRQDESPEQRRARGERSAMLEVCKVAAEVFRLHLRDPKMGAAARAYLETRGVNEAISERFQLGYGAAEWATMVDALRQRRQDLELAVKLGLIARRPSSSGYYDRFRDRLVCPVIVPGGDVVGFSARTLPPSAPPAQPDPRGEPPKYINSPESLVYKKSRLLFGLAQARDSMSQKGRAVLVEGNFDVITFHQAGIGETVAPLGTALTAEQVETLRRTASEVVLCYDGDRAGRAATRSALELLVAADIPVRVVALPDGEDPDSLVRKHGGGKAVELIERALGGVEYFCFEVWGKARDSADSNARALDDAARLITKVASPTKRDLIIGTLASAMKLDVQVVRKAVARQEGGRQAEQGPGYGGQKGYRGQSGGSGGERGGWSGGSGRSGGWGGQGGAGGQGRANQWGGQSSSRGGAPSGRGAGSAPYGASGRFDARSDSRFPGRSNDRAGSRSEFRPGARSDARPDDRLDPRFAPPEGRFDDARPDDRFDPRFEDRFEPGPADGFDDRFDDRGDPRSDPRSAEAASPAGSAGSHPNAPSAPARGSGAKASLPPIEEVELLALLSDHPSLLATTDADKAFSLLTDGRLRDMYSAAQQGQSMLEFAHAHLPQPTADLVLSGKYAAATDPRARLVALTDHLVRRAADVGLRTLGQRLADAKRRGDHELERKLVAEILSTRKQVD